MCKVKVTEEGEIAIFCPKHISHTPGGILMKYHRNVHFYGKL
jgi:hypothetical protein